MSSEWQAGQVVEHRGQWFTLTIGSHGWLFLQDGEGRYVRAGTGNVHHYSDGGDWTDSAPCTLLLPAPSTVTTWQGAWEALLPLTVRHDGNGAEDDPDYRVIDCDGHGVIRVFRPDLQTHGSHKIYLLAELCTDDAAALRTAATRLEVPQQWLSAVATTILAQSSGSDGKGEGTVTA